MYSGVGCIVCLHRVLPDRERSPLPENRALEMADTELRSLLEWVRRSALDPIVLDEVAERLATPSRAKFVAFTFDDGYRDNLTVALPLFREFGVPFAVNLTTGFVNREEPIWWYALERVLRERRALEFRALGETQRFAWEADIAAQNTMFETLARRIRGLRRAERREYLGALFAAGEVDARKTTDEAIMTWEEARTLAQDPLVTIGAHTESHCQLSVLPQAEAKEEMLGSKQKIEAALDREVRHFAYPFGGAQSAGRREFALARECGFVTAGTTRCANLFPEHRRAMQALPRLSIGGGYPAVDRFRKLESGLIPAIGNRFARVVTE